MRKFILILLFIPTGLFAQQIERSVVATAGGFSYSTAAGASISWTLGEVAVGTLTASSIILTQGFQQGGIEGTDVSTILPSVFGVSLYPNPVVETLKIRFVESPSGAMEVVFFDLIGRKISSMKFYCHQNQTQLELNYPVHSLSAGVYVIRIYSGTTAIFTSKVVKQ